MAAPTVMEPGELKGGHAEHEILAELTGKKLLPMLDIHKNPLLVSILYGCEMLKSAVGAHTIPINYLKHASGLLFMKTDKVGFGVSITQGYGLVIAKAPHRPSGWSAPLPVKVDGFSVGAVIGFSEQFTIVAFATNDEVNAFKADKRAMKLGVDVGLSLQDVYNKQVGVDTQSLQTGETSGLKTKAFTYSKGVMVDFALKGLSVEADTEDITSTYGAGVKPSDILGGTTSPPREATILYNELKKYVEKATTAT